MTTATVTPAATAGDLYARGLTAQTALTVRDEDGTRQSLPLRFWLGSADATDLWVLGRLAGPIVDLGCGPGRHVAALARRGVTSLGVDVSPVAVEIARARGAAACVRDVFGPLPAEGRWATALLLDGNVGIGGRPGRLLRRAASLLTPGGTVVVELEPPGVTTAVRKIRLEDGERASAWFAWAHVAVDDIHDIARGADLRVGDTYRKDGRWFADLVAA